MESTSIINFIVMGSIILPMIVFGLMAFYKMPFEKKELNDEEKLAEFLYTSGQSAPSDFSKSTVAYMLQIYVTFYFIYWGYNYGLSNIFYLLGWGFGIFLFVRFSPKIIMSAMQSETLPNILSKGYKEIRTIFGVMTAIYFAGMLYLETYFASDFINEAVQADGEKIVSWWMFFGFLLFFVLIYSSWGGMRKVFLTDRYQLATAYGAFAVILAYLLTKSFAINGTDGFLFAVLCISLYAFLVYRDLQTSIFLYSLVVLVGSLFLLLLVSVNGILKTPSYSSLTIGGPLEQLLEPGGWITLFGFTILNLLWQFSDASNYQRLCSISSSYKSDEEIRKILKVYFYPIIFVSPVTWGIGILIGIGTKTAGVTVPEIGSEYSALIGNMVSSIITEGNIFALLSIVALGIGVSSVMLSTADSSIMAFYQAIMKDFLIVKKWSSLRLVACSLVLALFVIGVAILVKSYKLSSIFTVVASFNAQILVAAPAVVLIICGRFSRKATVVSIVLGSVAVWWATFFPPEFLILESSDITINTRNQNILLVFPILVGLTAAIIPLLPTMLSKNKLV